MNYIKMNDITKETTSMTRNRPIVYFQSLIFKLQETKFDVYQLMTKYNTGLQVYESNIH